jgi:osmotically-inducible protein OsmY
MPKTNQPIDQEYVTEAHEPAGFRRPDGEIAEEIRNALSDDVGLDARRIHVVVNGGKVRLSGTVRNCADLRRAEGHACAVTGTTSVQSDLQPLDSSEDGEAPSEAGAAAKMGKPAYDV